MWSRKELKGNAKASLKKNYWKTVLAAFIMAFITGVTAGGSSQPAQKALPDNYFQTISAETGFSLGTIMGVLLTMILVSAIISLVLAFVVHPLTVGLQKFFIDSKTGDPEIGTCLMTCKGSWFHVGLILVLRNIFVALWSCLFFIPGIVKGYEYRMIPYLLAENPQMSQKEAFAQSKEMMRGQKWNAFVLDLSFIGWGILTLCTCGILNIFYVAPYVYLTDAELYLALKQR